MHKLPFINRLHCHSKNYGHDYVHICLNHTQFKWMRFCKEIKLSHSHLWRRYDLELDQGHQKLE